MSFVITGSSRGVITGGFGLTIDASELHAFAAECNNAAGRIGAKAATALRAGAMMMQRDAMASAPVDTGALRQSISTTFVGDGRSGTMAAEIGPTVEYGIYQELGTSTQAGTPFLAPAFDRNIGNLAAAISRIDIL